ncbi:MAG: hypothetical protein JNM56_07625, partial [Planctomycetia bacterium]|nr:hypothetical protein [Planctomycetia bacterium]
MNYLAALLRLMRRHLVPSQRGGPNGQRRSSYQPSIQALEDRWLPANIVWTGAMSDDWNTAGNWSLARVPGADDDVTINIERRAVLGASHTATVKSVAVDRASELIVDGWLLAGKVQNSGWLEVNDGATLEINRTGADALVTNLGNLLLSGRIEGSVDNKEQGIRLSSIFVFSSNAVIHGNLKDGGRINLEEATYRLKVLGDFEQTADGTLAMTIHLQNRAYISSQLTVRGKAKIAGSLVLESTVFNNYPQGTEVTVMFYDSLEGKFKEEFWDIKNAAGRFLPGYHKNSFDVYVPFLVHNWPADNFTNRFTEAFVAEGRIGNAGNDAAGNFTFELDVGRTTSAPASKSDYDWDPGTYSFALTYDPALSADSVSLTVSGATGTKTVSFQFDPAAWASTENDALFLRTRAVRAGSGIVLSDL